MLMTKSDLHGKYLTQVLSATFQFPGYPINAQSNQVGILVLLAAYLRVDWFTDRGEELEEGPFTNYQEQTCL